MLNRRGFADILYHRARRARSTLFLVFLAFFFVLFALVVFAHDFAVRINFDARLFAVLLDDGFIVRALLFPADNFPAFGFRLGRFLHCGRNISAADALFFVFLFPCLRATPNARPALTAIAVISLVVFMVIIFDRSVSRLVRNSSGRLPRKIVTLSPTPLTRSRSSLRCRETRAKENKKCTDGSIDPLPDCFTRAQSVAERGGKPRQDEAPDCAGCHKREPERYKGQDLIVGCRVDELRKKGEKKQRYFRIQNIGQNTLPEGRCARALSKIGWQTQLPAAIEKQFDSKKNQVSATEQFDRAKSNG